jgi:hypothetical protein
MFTDGGVGWRKFDIGVRGPVDMQLVAQLLHSVPIEITTADRMILETAHHIIRG